MMRRRPVNKKKSAKRFRKSIGKTARVNVTRPGRGGYRL